MAGALGTDVTCARTSDPFSSISYHVTDPPVSSVTSELIIKRAVNLNVLVGAP